MHALTPLTGRDKGASATLVRSLRIHPPDSTAFAHHPSLALTFPVTQDCRPCVSNPSGPGPAQAPLAPPMANPTLPLHGLRGLPPRLSVWWSAHNRVLNAHNGLHANELDSPAPQCTSELRRRAGRCAEEEGKGGSKGCRPAGDCRRPHRPLPGAAQVGRCRRRARSCAAGAGTAGGCTKTCTAVLLSRTQQGTSRCILEVQLALYPRSLGEPPGDRLSGALRRKQRGPAQPRTGSRRGPLRCTPAQDRSRMLPVPRRHPQRLPPEP